MPQLKLSADEVLTTTRAVRKRLDFDRPVEMSVLRECLDIATQAPSGSNSQGWHFVLVTDPDKKRTIADYYLEAFDAYQEQARALAAGGVDLMVIETQFALEEADAALKAVQSVTDLPTIVSFSYDRGTRTSASNR